MKSTPSTKLKTTPSAESMNSKKQINSEPSTSNLVSPSYKSFEEFRKRIELLKLPLCWDMAHINNEETVFKCFDNVYSVPKYKIYT